MTRLEANVELSTILNDLMLKNPDLRFSQILYAYGFVKPNRPTKDAGEAWQNEFYLEPEEVLKRVKERLKND